jgi:hypothetical protein
MKSEDETMENSDNAGEAPRWGGGVEGANKSGDGVERRVWEVKGRRFGCVGMGDAVGTGGAREDGMGLGLAFCLREVVSGEVFGRGGSFSEAVVTIGEDCWVGNMRSKESDRVEGAKRTPYERSAEGAELGIRSGEWGGDGTRLSVLGSRDTEDEARADGKAGEYRAIS